MLKRALAMRYLGLAAFLLLAGPHGSAAHAPAYDCAGSQQDMNQCAAATLRAADGDLNRRYQNALKSAQDDEARAKLRAAQRAWISFRDAACAVAADAARGGSLAPLLQLSCLEQMTRVRALELSQDMERPDPGLWVGGALAQLRENAPEAALRGTYWLPEGIVSADFDGDGTNDLAAAGLHPPDATGKGGRVHVLVLVNGSAKPLHAVVPIDGSGLCAAPLGTRVEYPANGRPVLVLDDGTCGAVRFSVDGTLPNLVPYQN